MDAATAGLFRIVFGTATLLYFVMYPVDASWLNRTFDVEIDGPIHQAIMDLLRGHPGIVDLISPALLVTGVAFIAGWMEQILSLFGNTTARHVGTVVSLFSPADAMWRRAAYELQPVTAIIFQAGPFGVASVPSAAMVVWAVVFVVAVLAFAAWQFRRRPL